MLERLRKKIIPENEVDREDYLRCLSEQDRVNLLAVVDWLSEQVGEQTAIWAVGSSVRECKRLGEVEDANDLDLRLFTNEPNVVIDGRVHKALEACPPAGFVVEIELDQRDFSTAHNGRLWPEDGDRPVNIISTAKGDSRPASELRWEKSVWLLSDGPFCRLKKVT